VLCVRVCTSVRVRYVCVVCSQKHTIPLASLLFPSVSSSCYPFSSVPPSRTLNRQIAIIAGVDGAEEQLGKVYICVFVSICVWGGEEAGENGRETEREKEADRGSTSDSE